MQSFDYDPTSRVLYGVDALDRLGELAQGLGSKQALVVTDRGIASAGHLQRALDSLHKAGLRTTVFDAVIENPTSGVVQAGADFARGQKIDCIVGLGGGSSMDCAKGINFLLTNGGRIEDYWGEGKATRPMLPSIGIPTTAGTGSEAQSFALISREETHLKMACGDKKARFRGVILDPALTLSMPEEVAAASALDAISHAVESFVATRRNPVSRMFAREGWRLLDTHFEASLLQPHDLEARGAMLLGAHWAGCSIEYSMLGAAHACANPLTARYDITHGTAVALMLPHVVRYNGLVASADYQDLLGAVGCSNGNPDSAAQKLSARIDQRRRLGGQPARLRDCRVERDSIPELARQAAEQWTGTFNPRPLDFEGLVQLYEEAY